MSFLLITVFLAVACGLIWKFGGATGQAIVIGLISFCVLYPLIK